MSDRLIVFARDENPTMRQRLMTRTLDAAPMTIRGWGEMQCGIDRKIVQAEFAAILD